jgi:hypothetical protein
VVGKYKFHVVKDGIVSGKEHDFARVVAGRSLEVERIGGDFEIFSAYNPGFGSNGVATFVDKEFI